MLMCITLIMTFLHPFLTVTTYINLLGIAQSEHIGKLIGNLDIILQRVFKQCIEFLYITLEQQKIE